jgi:hypothetical protein
MDVSGKLIEDGLLKQARARAIPLAPPFRRSAGAEANE